MTVYDSGIMMACEPGQVRNSAGGRAYKVDDLTLLNRFLVLGSEGNTYYAKPKPRRSAQWPG